MSARACKWAIGLIVLAAWVVAGVKIALRAGWL